MALVDGISQSFRDLGAIAGRGAERMGDIQSRRTEQIGAIHARQAEQSGQLWGNWAAQIGQQIAAIPEQQRQAKVQEQEGQLRALGIQRHQGEIDAQGRAAREVQDVQAIIQAHHGDVDAAWPEIQQRGGKTGADLYASVMEGRKKAIDAGTAQNTQDKAKLDSVVRDLNFVNDEATWQSWIPKLGAIKPEAADALKGKPYDPQEVERLKGVGLSAAESIKVKQDALDRADRLSKEGPERDKNARASLGSVLSLIDPNDPQGAEKQARVIESHRVMGTPPGVLAEFSAVPWSKDAPAQFGQMALTQEQRETAKRASASSTPKAGTFEDYVTRSFGPNPSPAQILTARKAYGQSDDRPRVDVRVGSDGQNNVKDAVAGMKEGTLPPMLPGRATKDYLATLAEAKRQGYDLAAAVSDWNATQKHINTLNGAQQTRLQQAINSLPEMLDSVDALSDKWKGGRFPVLNKANLALAQGGAYGSDVASVANQLHAQIADITADLGNVYMGGNSPTDHALGLAAKSLSADWDQKVLRDMTALARKNVTIRLNSIRNTGVAGLTTGPQAAPVAPPAATVPPAALGPNAFIFQGRTLTFPTPAKAAAAKKELGVP